MARTRAYIHKLSVARFEALLANEPDLAQRQILRGLRADEIALLHAAASAECGRSIVHAETEEPSVLGLIHCR